MIHSYESDQLPKYEPCIMKEETKSPYNWAMHTCMLSHFSQVQLFATPWTIARQASLCMGFSSKNIGVGCHFLLQGIFSTQVLNPCLLHLLHWLAGSLSLSPLAIRVILYIRTKTGLRTDGHGFWPQPSRCKWCGFQQYSHSWSFHIFKWKWRTLYTDLLWVLTMEHVRGGSMTGQSCLSQFFMRS